MKLPHPKAVMDWNHYPNLPYHNKHHTLSFNYDSCPSIEAFWAAIYHDVHYDPLSTTNEEAAFEVFVKDISYDPILSSLNVDRIKHLIMSTKDHVESIDYTDRDMIWLHANDLAYLRETNLSKVIETEYRIFQEYQFVSYDIYRNKRIQILTKLRSHSLVSEEIVNTIIGYLNGWNPNVGVFCGSFNMMHKGHLAVIHQAEKIFDKVIVAQGQNIEKNTNMYDINELDSLKYYEKHQFQGSLFDFLSEKNVVYPKLSLIRGLRNNDDLEHESILNNFKNDYINIPSVFFLVASELRHISSSAIRQLVKLGKNVDQYIVK